MLSADCTPPGINLRLPDSETPVLTTTLLITDKEREPCYRIMNTENLVLASATPYDELFQLTDAYFTQYCVWIPFVRYSHS